MENDDILDSPRWSSGEAGEIQKISEEAGFDLVGIVEVKSEEGREKRNRIDEWVKNAYCADMKWMEESLEKRKNILKVMPEAKSVICVAMNYYCNTDNTNKEKSVGKIARYARGRPARTTGIVQSGGDYHKIFDKKLKLFAQKLKEIFPASPEHQRGEPNGEFKYYSDTGPILERMWAEKAGLGFIGKNTNLITKYGSWVLLGEVITNIAISPLAGGQLAVSHSITSNTCGSCRKCLDICPTGALCAPYTMDARKCISYLTIEHKGEIPMELREKMGNRIFGCDACQEVCPFNIGRQKEAQNELTQKAIAGTTGDLKELLSTKTDEEFLKKFAGSPLMRAKRRGLVRNACVAAGNLMDKSLLPHLKECLKDEEPIIVGHAKWAIEKLGKEI